jgi:hypothetical protein
MALYPRDSMSEGQQTARMYLVFNPDTTPVRATLDGHIVGARETVWIDTDDRYLLDVIAAGRLRLLREPTTAEPTTAMTEPPMVEEPVVNEPPAPKEPKIKRSPAKKTAQRSPRKSRATSKKSSD